MHVFYYFLFASFIVLFGVLFKNGHDENEKKNLELENSLKQLKEDLKCAISTCVCDRALELQKRRYELEKEYDDKCKEYEKLNSLYKKQDKVLKFFTKNLSKSKDFFTPSN